MFIRFSVALLLSLVTASVVAAPLPRSVLSALRQANIPLSGVGIEVLGVNARKPVISVNARQPMNPASTMKLLTTYAALDMLGPAYTWKTEAYLGGKLEKGVLHGDLILKGYGDPDLTLEQFWLWLRDLRSRGLKEIRGNLVLDRSAFQLAPYDPSEFDNDPIRAYNVGPDALLLNFNALRLRYIPEGEKVEVVAEPDLAGTRLDNHVTVSATGDCNNWTDAVFPQMNGDTLLLEGSFPLDCGEREQHVNLLPHAQYLYDVFRALWQEVGGKLDGELREGIVPGDASLFSTHLSAPLAEQIRDINKFSNNVMARQLFLTLSLGPDPDTPASINRSEQVVHDWLAKNKLHFPELVVDNGAGLSRKARISPQSIAMLLQEAQHSSLQPEFETSLPIVGVDGTLKKRLSGNSVTGHAHLKTGTLEGVKAIAGYVHGHSGKQWIVVFVINHPNAAAGQRAQDELIEWVRHQY
ncbi:MAG: D-alanyl-D-alanine carboxypeptidase/D-alanyl-D-alanine-endopeptidase [Sideroxydans sp.]|nr:D-alanyl-D-alanine carboxypeptidase/D-alanyl-D-alanine-endopeptidase [Sideroxydans sp.]